MQIKQMLGINSSSEEAKQFLAIEINTETVKTAIWQVKDKQTQIVNLGTVEEWRGESAEELVTATDNSLIKAFESLDKEPEEVIFGLPETWVSDDGIAESKKKFLKAITQKLDLKPVGFVVTTESIVHYLKQDEGGPPSAVLLNLSETEVAVTIIQLGNIVGTQVVGRSEDLSKDVEEGLARFSGLSNIPSRIILFDGNIDLESAKQTLISYDWQEKLSFLHFPKIEALSHDATIKAIAVAGGTEVARSLGIEVTSIQKEEIEVEKEVEEDIKDEPKKEPAKDELQQKDPSKEKNLKETLSIKDKSDDFGFTDPKEKITKKDELPKKSNLKVPKQQDVRILKSASKTPELIEIDDHKIKVSKSSSNKESEQDQEIIEPKPTSKSNIITSLGSSISNIIKNFSLPKLKFSTPKFMPSSPLIIIGVILLLMVFVGGFIAYWNLPKANITIFVSPKVIEKEVSFTLDPDLDILDADNGMIPAKEQSVELEGEKEIPTTGQNLVGERATGTVSVYNRTQSSKTFEVGTKINIDNFFFTLDETISIASASTEVASNGIDLIIVASEESSPVTATAIGDEYNFAKDTQFSVANFAKSSFFAKATGDFSGGFSREIQAASKEDHKELLDSLTEELKNQTIDKLSNNNSTQRGVVELDTPEIIKEIYSADIGDEADNVKLSLKLKMPIFTYHFTDVSLLMEKENQEDIPENFVASQENIEIEVIESELDDNNTVIVTAKVKLKLIPKLDKEVIISNIRGKYPPLTEEYFSSLPNFSKVETQFNFSLPARLKTFPRVSKNITVDVKIEE